MPIVQAYKCEVDGKLFDDKSKYIQHLRKIGRKNLEKKSLQKLQDTRNQFMGLMGQVKSIDELETFIKDNWRWFFTNGYNHKSWRTPSIKDFHEYVNVRFTNIRWGEAWRNSHSCPIGGVTNFDTKCKYNEGKPTSYPGWTGSISIVVKPPMRTVKGKQYITDGFGSDYFRDTIIHTGSGGGGGGEHQVEYSYDVTLWAADFPVMYNLLRQKQHIEMENAQRTQIWKTLGGNNNAPLIDKVPDNWVCVSPWKILP